MEECLISLPTPTPDASDLFKGALNAFVAEEQAPMAGVWDPTG
jgi:hypothetical protein